MSGMNGHRRARAFTMVEILVVIGVLALLLGMLLPALSGAQRRSLKHRELNAIRQVGLGWTMYANGNNDKLLPGYLDTAVQEKWRVSYEYPNHESIPPAPGYGSGANLAGPWTWRLLPYLEFNHDMVHGYTEEDEFDAVNMGKDLEESAAIAVYPGFGYNGFYVGGYWTMETGFARPRFYEAKLVENGSPTTIGVNVLSKSIGTIRRSTELITFCSSSDLAPGTYRKFSNTQRGSYLVMPSWLGDDEQWEWAGALEVHVQTSAPIGRYNGLAATLYADGHTGANLLDDLWRNGMRNWIDAADDSEFRHD